MIVTGIKAGVELRKLSDTIGISEADLKIFLAWWQDLGKPDWVY